uniref:Uncharacterized protein n=1 Tax=Urocitellus parryii TaxID=9999 RepID=A0A8D2ICI9_UROPR
MRSLSFLSSEVLAGDLMSPFDQSGLGAQESLGLLDDYLEVAKHFKPHGFSGDKASSSEWLAVDGLVNASVQLSLHKNWSSPQINNILGNHPFLSSV